MEPITMTIIGISILLGGFGVKKGADANESSKSAQKKNESAQEIFKTAKGSMEKAKSRTTKTLSSLGELKLNIWANQVGKFATSFERLKDLEITGDASVGELKKIQEAILEMKDISFKAKELTSGGAAALGAGALVGVASYGGAMLLASASTGTAIAALSGAAATNATLAWFGGGSLAAGGLGMSGGIAVLGGVVAGPVLAVGGIFMDAQARKKLAAAKKNLSEAKKAAAEMKNAEVLLDGIKSVSDLFTTAIKGVCSRFDKAQLEFDRILDSYDNAKLHRRLIYPLIHKLLKRPAKISYKKLQQEEKEHIHLLLMIVQVLKGLLEAPLLTEEGGLDSNYQKALNSGNEFLEAHVN
jgi:hypothetical protein